MQVFFTPKVGDLIKLTLEGLVHVTEVLSYRGIGIDSVGLVVKKYERLTNVTYIYDIYIEGKLIKEMFNQHLEELKWENRGHTSH